MLHYMRRKLKQRFGFTLVETMIVITIIAVLALVARTSVMTIRKNMDLTEANNNAKTIYMASQANLTQMRSMGELPKLMDASVYDSIVSVGSKYYISCNKPGDTSKTSTSYGLIVPASVDATIRNQQVLLVYHPSAGIVHSVFYYEGKSDLSTLYAELSLKDAFSLAEDKKEAFAALLKEYGIGHYTVDNVDAMTGNEFEVRQTAASISFENSRDAVVTVAIPIRDKSNSDIFTAIDYNHYISGLEVSLIITGQNGGQTTKTYKSGDQGVTFKEDIANHRVVLTVLFDTLTSSFYGFSMEMVNDQLQRTIAPGDNISVTADVTYYPQSTDPIVLIDSATIAGINPMFHALTDNPGYTAENGQKPYILSIANGRHLQNLSYLDADLAEDIESVVFTKENEEDSELALTWYEGAEFKPLNLSNLPDIVGNGVQIKNLVIKSVTEGSVGLFGTLTNTTVDGITLVDPNIATTGTDATGALIITDATGALVGTADNVTITDCHVTSTNNTISGMTNVGGLVGIATNNTQIEKCTSKATVIGSSGVTSNIGGLVGSVKDASIISCVVENANIKSSSGSGTDTSKNALGGLVGAVNNTTYDLNKPIRDCDVKDTVNVISVTGSLSDLGGMVGNATNAYIAESNSSAYVTGQATSNNTNPNNNLGGFVGRSKDSRYAVIDVILNYKPQYAENAGGFAGIMSSDSVENLDILFKLNNDDAWVVTNFGGIASRCSDGAELKTVKLVSEITFNLAKEKTAGGFCYFGTGCRIEYSAINIKEIKENKEFNGFAMAGFAVENAGTIKNCFSYVKMDGGAAFVQTNNGSVVNCVGWALGEKESTLALKNCQNSYFVDRTNKVVLYNNTAVVTSINDTDALSGNDALEALNEGNDGAWIKDNGKHPYPVLAGLKDWTQEKDPYNRFNGFFESLTFFGPVISNQPYALRYVETYDDGTTSDLIVHYSADGKASIAKDNLMSAADLKTKGLTISSTAYYLCHRDGSLNNATKLYASGNDGFTAELEKFQLNAANERFTIYKLNPNTNYPALKLNSCYPLNDVNSYRIRTDEQFQNIAHNLGGTFYLENSITVSGAVQGTFTGKLYGTADTVITANVHLFEGIDEKAVINNCKINTPLDNPFGTFNGAQQIANATHWATADKIPAYVDGFKDKFNKVTGTATKVLASLDGCTINGENVIRHFYDVKDTEMEELSATKVTLTYVDENAELLSALEAGTTPLSGYYVKVSDTSYEPLTKVEVSENEYVLTTGSASYTDVTTLYTVNGTIPTGISGSCYLMLSNKYLTVAEDNLVLEDTVSAACVWTVDGNGNYTNSDVTINADDIFKLSGEFTIQKITKYYESTYLGAGIEIAIS